MRKSRSERLIELENFLWEQSIFGTTRKQIAEALGIRVSSYLVSLMNELIEQEKAIGELIPSPKGMIWRYFAVHSSVKQIRKLAIPTPLYTPIDTWTFDNNHCFLCGTSINRDNRTDEHVFPRWLQTRYKLFTQKLGLLNRTEIPYKNVLIPCCSTCNSIYLNRLETVVAAAHDAGYEAFCKLPKIVIFQWLTKIFYGILFRELSLLHDRRDASLGYIFSDEALKKYHTLHQFLQSVRLPMVFNGFAPWSIFIVKMQPTTSIKLNFDYRDDIYQLFFSLRMGEIGIIACLEDAGVQEDVWKRQFEDIKALALHPVQFDELCAKVHYSLTLMTRIPTYIIRLPENIHDVTQVSIMPLAGLSSKPILQDWVQEDYARVLAAYWKIYNFTSEFIYEPPNLVRSMLFFQEGELQQLDSTGHLVKTIKISEEIS